MEAETRPFARPAALSVARSFSTRRWVLAARDEEAARKLAQHAEIPLPLAQFLSSRGVGIGDVADILNPTLKRLLPEPLTFKDMERAITRTRAAIDAKENIAIFGDYDVDGSVSAAMLHEFLSSFGLKPRIYIPDRLTEGYGPSARALGALREEGASLVIAVDCGANAHEPLAAAREAGLDVIVLDHHAAEGTSPALAHVNPNQPGDPSGHGHLCAAGVTFMFLVGLNRDLREWGFYGRSGGGEPDLRRYLDLVALATVCDVVPLKGVNRAFVRQGLARLAALERRGLAALAATAGVAGPFTAYHLGFVFGPRINAGGRVGRCDLGVELLISSDIASAAELATLLDLHNRERQAIEKAILEEAMGLAAGKANAPFLLVTNEGWHPGVVGVVAGRLKDRFGKPTFVAGFEGGQGRGSARSVGGVDIGAIIRDARDRGLIDGGGGHAMAGGFSLSENQRDRFETFLAEQFSDVGAALERASTLSIDAVVSPAGATIGLIDQLACAGPFGAGNPEPLFVAPDVQVTFAETVGDNHLRLRLVGADGARLDAIAFRVVDQPLGKQLLASRGRRVHAAGRLRTDEWQGQRRVRLELEDAAAAEA
jgi:single-stranded-DNA-specific exonuclease